MFIVIGVLFLAVGIGVTVCMLKSLDLCSYCFKNTNRRWIFSLHLFTDLSQYKYCYLVITCTYHVCVMMPLALYSI